MSEFPPSDELTSGQANSVHTNAIQGGDLLMWAIYDSPSDHPGKFIARPYSLRRQAPLRCHLAAPSLDAIRELLPPALYPLTRQADDDPVIVETWI